MSKPSNKRAPKAIASKTVATRPSRPTKMAPANDQKEQGRQSSKQARVVAMLRSPTGATNVADVEQIAAREKCSVRQVNMTISLAFLSPTLVKAAIDGRLPRGIGVAHLRDAPAEWSRQHAMLGLAS